MYSPCDVNLILAAFLFKKVFDATTLHIEGFTSHDSSTYLVVFFDPEKSTYSFSKR